MRIRVLKSVISIHGNFAPGAVVDIPDSVAKAWCRAGVAMEEKSLDGAKETKAEPKNTRGGRT